MRTEGFVRPNAATARRRRFIVQDTTRGSWDISSKREPDQPGDRCAGGHSNCVVCRYNVVSDPLFVDFICHGSTCL